MAQLKATGITGSLEVTTAYITGSITGSDAKFTSLTASSIQGAIVGNADTATKLATARTISASGDVVWGVSFDGSGNVTGVAAIGSGVIVNDDINASAAIVDTKLATISTAGKVSNSATTATNANTANAIVARDASGNFSAGTITATLNGNASTATQVSTSLDLSTNASRYIPFVNNLSGINQGLSLDGALVYNPGTNSLTASSFVGDLKGNAATVTNGIYTTNISSYATTAVTAGTGLSGGGTTGSLTLDLDFSELTDKTADITGATEFILRDEDGTTESRKAASEIKLSFFNNDSGWTSNVGTVTSIATNNGITGGTITSAGTVGLTGQALALHNLSTNGLITRTGAGTVAGRTIAGGTGITVTNGDGVSGNPSIALTNNSLTVGSTSISLGGTATTIAGLASVTSTGFTGSLDGNATTATTATNATNVATTQELSTNAERFIPFVDDFTTTNQGLKVDGGLSYNPSTNSLTASVFVGSLQGSVEGTAFRETGVGMRITNPEGATFHQGSGGTSGSIAIQFPSALGAFMASIKVRVFDHFSQGSTESYDVICGGYHGGSSWGTHHAHIVGAPGTDSDYPIRFANSGSSAYIIIGDPDEPARDYLNVAVTEVNVGGYNLAAQSTWSTGWDIRIVPDNLNEFSVQYTENDNQIGASTSITTDNATNNSGYIPMSLGTSTGATSLTVDTSFYFNPSTNTLTAPTFAGNLAWSNVTGTPTTVSGYGITDAVGTGANNTFTADNTFNNNITIGSNSFGNGVSSTSHLYSVGIGYQVLNSANSSANSVAIGYRSMFSATSANNTTAVGSHSLINLTNGTFNTAVGYQAGYSVTTGYRNVFLGSYAGFYGSGHNNNIAIGYYAMVGSLSTASPYRNIAVGTEALRDLTTGDSNVAMGYQAGLNVENGYGNTVIGYGAGDSLTSADYNTFVGRFAGEAVTTGNNNTIIGAGYSGTSTMANTVVLADGSGNARLYIDNNGYAGFQTTTPGWAIEVDEDRSSNPSAYFKNTNASGYGLYVAAGAQDGSTKYLIRFLDNSLSFIANISHVNGAVTYGAFTGNHPATISDFEQETYEYGTIVKVESSQLVENTNQPLFVCSKTTSAKQKSAFGVYAAKEEQEGIHSIFALGDGHILVNAEGGDIEIGDYICSSNTAGIGMKQDDDLLHNYTVAKAAENVIWANESEQTKLIVCTYHSA